MDNKTTFLILLATMLVTLGGTTITLNKLSDIEMTRHITGFATSDTGTGRILIAKQVSIVVNTTDSGLDTDFHEDINFGSCVPFFTHNINITSNESNDADGAHGNCSGSAFPDYIHIYNTGNVDANITIQTDTNSTNFISSGSNSAMFGYKTTNGNRGPNNETETFRDGCEKCQNTAICAGSAPANVTNWVNFRNQTGMKYFACQNLTWSSSGQKPSFRTYLFVQIPTDAQSSNEVTALLTYTGSEIS